MQGQTGCVEKQGDYVKNEPTLSCIVVIINYKTCFRILIELSSYLHRRQQKIGSRNTTHKTGFDVTMWLQAKYVNMCLKENYGQCVSSFSLRG